MWYVEQILFACKVFTYEANIRDNVISFREQGYGQMQNPHVQYRNVVIEKMQNTYGVVSLVAENLSLYMDKVRELVKSMFCVLLVVSSKVSDTEIAERSNQLRPTICSRRLHCLVIYVNTLFTKSASRMKIEFP